MGVKELPLNILDLKEMTGKKVDSVLEYKEGDYCGFILGFNDGSALRVRHVHTLNQLWVSYLHFGEG
jgi:hypothetical protein